MNELIERLSSFFISLFSRTKKPLKQTKTNYKGYERAEAHPPYISTSSDDKADKAEVYANKAKEIQEILTESIEEISQGENSVKVEPTPAPEIFDEPKEEPDKTFRYPVEAIGVTAGYSVPSHMGIDFGFFNKRGGIHTPIISATPGQVVKVWNFSDAGLTVRVRFDDDKYSWYAQYKHLYKANVSAGDTVNVGDPIGLMGDSGGYAGQYHLHFDLVRCPRGYTYLQSSVSERKKYSVNPLLYLFVKNDQFVGDDTKAKYRIIDGKLVMK